MIMATDKLVPSPQPLTTDKFEIINSLTVVVDWRNRAVQLRQVPAGGVLVIKPVVMLLSVDDLMLVAAQVLQLQAQHNKSVMAEAIKSGLVKP